MLVCLLALVSRSHLGPLSLAGIGVVAALLVYEHRLVNADDLSRVDAAFFTVNGYVSVLFFLFWSRGHISVSASRLISCSPSSTIRG